MLSVEAIPSSEESEYHFKCAGIIDVRADDTLKPLRTVPSGARVLLDFREVERVNSMGLSLLLKIFEEWEANGTQVEVYNLNRMVAMLFKITGLGRFSKAGSPKSTAPARSTIRPKQEISPTTEASIPRPVNTTSRLAEKLISPFRRRAAVTETRKSIRQNDKNLLFIASLPSGQQRSGWYSFNTFLQRMLQRPIEFEHQQNVLEIGEKSTDLFFARPFLVCNLIKRKSFIPIMRSCGNSEEVVILSRAEETRELADFSKPRVATAARESFVYYLGRTLCDESGLNSGDFQFTFAGNEIRALQLLRKQQVDLLFLQKRTYKSLSSFTRNVTNLLSESEADFTANLFCIAPHLNELKACLTDVLLNMNDDPEGQKILEDIKVDSWRKPKRDELSKLKTLFDRYQDK